MRLYLTLIAIILSIASAGAGGDFELILDGHGDINSYIYFQQDSAFLIDTEINVSIETLRYKQFRLSVDLYKETSMGRKYNSNMIFDPTRAHWSFGLTGRMELSGYFYEFQFHHDCFHSIDRWEDRSIYWNSPRVGFGSLGYLPKNKFHKSGEAGHGFQLRPPDFYLLASFFAPRGISWQKTHDYDFTLDANIFMRIYRMKSIGMAIESNNFLVLNREHELRFRNHLALDFILYGQKGVLMAYLAWWPHDDQAIRQKEGRAAFGLHLGF